MIKTVITLLLVAACGASGATLLKWSDETAEQGDKNDLFYACKYSIGKTWGYIKAARVYFTHAGKCRYGAYGFTYPHKVYRSLWTDPVDVNAGWNNLPLDIVFTEEEFALIAIRVHGDFPPGGGMGIDTDPPHHGSEMYYSPTSANPKFRIWIYDLDLMIHVWVENVIGVVPTSLGRVKALFE
jgi:hypothetical protein